MPILDYKSFMNHSSGSSGGGFLGAWTDDGSIDVWTHPRAPIGARWAHGFKSIRTKKDRQGDEIETIAFDRWGCHEPEAILRKQRFRNDDGSREHPPTICPMDMVIEHVRMAILDGQIPLTAVLFKFETDDDEEKILAGGFCGLFQSKDLSKVQLAEMRKAGVEVSEAYRENCGAKLDYIMRVVSASDPTAGIMIANVQEGLGRKIQGAFNQRMVQTKNSKHPFDPSQESLCMRWLYDKNKDFEKKFEVIPLPEEEMSAEVAEALDAEPPSIDNLIAPGSVQELFDKIEQYALIKLPLDELFEKAFAAEDAAKEAAKRGDDAPAATKPTRTQAQVPASRPEPKPALKAAPADGEGGGDTCDVCDAPLGPDDLKCANCGSTYHPVTFKLKHDTKAAGEWPPPAPKAEAGEEMPAARRATRGRR